MKLGRGLGKALKTLLLYGGWRGGGKNFYKILKFCKNSSGLERRRGGGSKTTSTKSYKFLRILLVYGFVCLGATTSTKFYQFLSLLLVWVVGGGDKRDLQLRYSVHICRQTTIVVSYLFVYYCPLADMVFSFCLLSTVWMD